MQLTCIASVDTAIVAGERDPIMLFRPPLFGAILLAVFLAGCGQKRHETQMHEVRMAVLPSSNDPAMAKRWDHLQALIAKATGLPTKLYQADYNGTIQAMTSNQVDVATLAGGGYANVDAQIGKLAAPILTIRAAEGSLGYYSAIIVKRDSPYHSLADLKGRSFAYVDFNSTSGYLYPRAKMREQGINPDTFFGKTAFSGGHFQSVLAMKNGQFDAALVEMLGGTPETGFSSGAYYLLARNGLINPTDFRTIWIAGPIPNGALVVRTDRPQWFIDTVRGAVATVAYDDPKTWTDTGEIEGATYTAADRSQYEPIIKLRSDDLDQRRGHRP